MDRPPTQQFEKTDAQHQLEYESRWAQLVIAAREERDHAISYRGFQVGCAILAWNGSGYKTFVGKNLKATKEDSKFCSEMDAFAKARDAGFNRIVAVVVVSRHSETDDEAFADPNKALEPCDQCQKMFRKAPEIRPATVLAMVNDLEMKKGDYEGGITIERTMGEFLRKTNRPQQLQA